MRKMVGKNCSRRHFEIFVLFFQDLTKLWNVGAYIKEK